MTLPPFAAGSYAAARNTATLLELKGRLDGLTTQLATGRVANTYGGLGPGRTTSLSAHATIGALDGYAAAIGAGQTRIKLATASVTQVETLADDVRRNLAANLTVVGSSIVSENGQVARNSLAAAVDALNQQVAGQYIFGGRATDKPPVVPIETMLDGDRAAGLDGLRTLIAEQKAADLGSAGNGRLIQTLAGTRVDLAEEASAEARANFGFSLLAGAGTGGLSARLTPAVPATVALAFAEQPQDGTRVRVVVSRPDGGQSVLDLTARSIVAEGAADAFAIGADATETAANLRRLLGDAPVASVQSAAPPGLSAAFSGGSPARLALSVDAVPAPGDALTLKLGLRDGTTHTLTLTARTPVNDPAREFAPGATAAETAANLSAALTAALTRAGGTELAASATTRAAQNFFDGTPTTGLAPRRVAADGNGYVETASPGTVLWYQGDDTLDPRATATVQVGANQHVAVGAQANEAPIRTALAALAGLAADTFTDAGGLLDEGRFRAVAERAVDLLTPGGGPSLADIATDLGLASARMEGADAQARATKAALQESLAGVETISTEEVAARLLTLQTQLQASYQITSMISKLTLVNYL